VGGLADNFNDSIVGEEQVNVGVAGLEKLLPQRNWFGRADRVDALALLRGQQRVRV
jgi:hypothetical protein